MPEAASAHRPTYIGVRLPRIEDERLLTGRARFLADIRMPDMLEVALVRSSFAHARIGGISTASAAAAPGNLKVDTPVPNPEVAGIFERAHRVVSGRYMTQRYSAVPMETRGTLARWDDGRLSVWTTTQFPHICRTLLAHVLSIPERDIR